MKIRVEIDSEEGKAKKAEESLKKHWWGVENRDFALDVVKTFISAFGLVATVFAGVGLFLNYQGNKEDRRLTQERLVTDRFSKAVEQLGKDKTTVRIGGIYALERIAKDSPKDFWTIMEVLTSYVRENSSLPSKLKKLPKNEQEREQRQKELENLTEVKIDVQTVLTVIRRRKDPKPNREEKIDLRFTNLEAANLEAANLEAANLEAANLEAANLEAANLRYANLRYANLRYANLRYANLRYANLSSADLRYAKLYRAKLYRANLRYADLRYANLSSANLRYANLRYANLSSANLRYADLRYANLSSANLRYADLYRANLDGAYLIKVQNLTSSQIKSACFWSEAIYKGKWNDEKKSYVAIEPDNTNFIEKLKKDFSSDPKEPPNCSRWSTE